MAAGLPGGLICTYPLSDVLVARWPRTYDVDLPLSLEPFENRKYLFGIRKATEAANKLRDGPVVQGPVEPTHLARVVPNVSHLPNQANLINIPPRVAELDQRPELRSALPGPQTSK